MLFVVVVVVVVVVIVVVVEIPMTTNNIPIIKFHTCNGSVVLK
jgi:hypothetical protein